MVANIALIPFIDWGIIGVICAYTSNNFPTLP